ncbi:MAG TPA: UvrD-helicase domain-containing protein, partial [Acidobacteriota bacterium]|nr:UvrD-helicase domain-containing protein [Acidobacteriota bacterium]
MKVARFFEANAGTGKTSRLTETIVEAVRGGLPLDKVCALTFTEKAANEMVERLRSKIAALVDSGEMQPGTLEKLNDCFIGTIHGFCLQVLKRYGEKIGL